MFEFRELHSQLYPAVYIKDFGSAIQQFLRV